MNTKAAQPLPGMPLDKDEILQRWIQFEDDRMHRDHLNAVVPTEVMKKEVKDREWTEASKYVFGRGIIRFAHSLLP
jgi:hypothetical protein